MSADRVARPEEPARTGTIEREPAPSGPIRRGRPEPVRRTLATIHRWVALVVGSLLLVQMTCGVPLLFGAELFRTHNADLYQPTYTSAALTAGQAVSVVHKAHPGFVPGSVTRDEGMWLVADAHLNLIYGVDPGSGRITGSGHFYGGFQGLMENIHAFGLSSPNYPGYVPFMAHTVPSFGVAQLEGVTYGSALVGILGVVLLLLALSGIVLWWPGIKRLASGFRVRAGKSRYVRDRELHKVVGIVAIPFLLMWGLTGAAAQFPFIQQAFLVVTGGNTGHADVKSLNWAFSSDRTSSPTGADIGIDTASKAALATVAGTIHNTSLPDPADPTSAYLFEISQPSGDPYSETMLAGNGWVYVDRYDAGHVKVVWGGHGSTTANTFYEQVVYPSHFGWYVSGGWRLIWAAFGLSPLLLAVTGISTWLVRTRKRRARQARRQAVAAT
ncbi:PepSY-associated TM helix domain-containing protein [Streptomyces sp. NPDC058067]|uniref:PepSY-associated TM helix domain-containing protein n=1 Tax=Streptomyces sp. NPDC058067 TaxID=3346324 RepID=UPI0036E23572